MFAPAQLPWGTLTSKLLSLLYVPFMPTLKEHGLRYLLNHFKALALMPYLLLSMDSRISWSTVSKAADRSNAISEVIDYLSMPHSKSLLTLKIAVLQE